MLINGVLWDYWDFRAALKGQAQMPENSSFLTTETVYQFSVNIHCGTPSPLEWNVIIWKEVHIIFRLQIDMTWLYKFKLVLRFVKRYIIVE